MVRPMPIVPLGLRNAMPDADALALAPHWLSNPSSVYTAPSCLTLSVTTLQYGAS